MLHLSYRSALVLCSALTLAPCRSAAQNPKLVHTYDGSVANGQFGVAVTVVGDMDGDGRADFAIGASADATGGPGAGRVFIYRGGTPLSGAPAWTLTGAPGDLLGASLAAAGDVNGDGFVDLLAGAPGSASVVPGTPGRALLVFGSTILGSRLPLSISGTASLGRFGASVAGLYRFDGDGFDDFAVGAPDAHGGAGEVRVFRGASSPSTTPALVLHGRAAGDNFGTALAGVGRTRGGAYADLLAGAPYNSEAGVWKGKAYLHLGGAAPDTLADRTWVGGGAGDLLGYSVAGAGDVNRDGRDDWLVGAPEVNTGTTLDTGRAYLYLGAPTPPTTPALTLAGTGSQEELGFALAALGDVNGDARSDFAVGSPGGASTAGVVHLYLGKTTLTTLADTTYVGETSGDLLGEAISSGGRVSGGARDLFLLGSYGHASIGRAYLYGTATAASSSGAPSGAPHLILFRNPSVRFHFAVDMTHHAFMSLDLVDVAGHRITALARGDYSFGRHEFTWNPADETNRVAAGV